MADPSTTTSGTFGNLLGSAIPSIAGLWGNNSAANALVSGENAAIGTQQGLQGTLQNIFGSQTGLGNNANTALATQLGLNGQPADFSPYYNSPGFQFSLGLGNQAINRNAAAQGNLYTPNTMQALSQYNTGMASQNYNNYINQLLTASGIGAQGNQALAQGMYNTGTNISQAQQNIGNANAAAAANNAGIGGSLAGSLLSYLLGNGSGNSNSSGVGSLLSQLFGNGSSSNFGGSNPAYSGVVGPTAQQGGLLNSLKNTLNGGSSNYGADAGGGLASLSGNNSLLAGIGQTGVDQLSGDIAGNTLRDVSVDPGLTNSSDLSNLGGDFSSAGEPAASSNLLGAAAGGLGAAGAAGALSAAGAAAPASAVGVYGLDGSLLAGSSLGAGAGAAGAGAAAGELSADSALAASLAPTTTAAAGGAAGAGAAGAAGSGAGLGAAATGLGLGFGAFGAAYGILNAVDSSNPQQRSSLFVNSLPSDTPVNAQFKAQAQSWMDSHNGTLDGFWESQGINPWTSTYGSPFQSLLARHNQH